MNASAKPAADTPVDVWARHIKSAVGKFLKTAVVIDNDPQLAEDPFPAEATNSSASGGYGLLPEEELVEPSADEIVKAVEASVGNSLDVRGISDSFASHGMACAFVLPHNQDTDVESIKRRVVSSAKTADILIVDWHLRPHSSGLTIEVLKEVAEADLLEGGRLRLICIYTGENLSVDILNEVKRGLTVDGVVFQDVEPINEFGFVARSETSLVVLANKDSIPAKFLPAKLVDAFSELANGIIPAFALAAIGAVRKNTHHMLTRFGKSLDSAYIANRLITDPPGDVAELMRELLVAECDNAIGLDSVADEYLEPSVIKKWLDVNSPREVAAGDLNINRDLIDSMLLNGVSDGCVRLPCGASRKFPESHRHRVSQSLVSEDAEAASHENEFSRLVAFRREAFGGSVSYPSDTWLPSLTTGSLLKLIGADGPARYFLCFTPACDAVRIKKERPFVFVEGQESSKPYSLVSKSETGESIGLYFDKTYPKVSTYLFNSDETRRVRADKEEINGQEMFVFNTAGQNSAKFLWLGDMRYGRAMSEMASLASRWMRIGILDSEYLRLAGKKYFGFSV
ncbi:response regulator receiver domain [Pseudomonas aeruginosa]|uniref:response regulator receiver domain n=1 Tax=Pseudomonas aeruginosa TaxID=287 RepID=UPI000F528EEA|nr:response regulator receiver domain [Pseudomonas aeruginosa]